jgi:hypothetical protein
MLRHINVCFRSDISILGLAFLVKEVIGYFGEIQEMGWKATIPLKEVLYQAYQPYLKYLDAKKT